LTVLIERFLAEQSEAPAEPGWRNDEWDFDPDRHSAADHFEAIAEYIDNKADDAPLFSRAKGAFDWLEQTLDIDLSAMERRWKEFPVIAVPKAVSDAHGLTEPQSLFAYLENIRLAYLAGAFLAAISMCRAATEILIRDHFNEGDHDTKLTPLIKSTQDKREFAFMRKFNLVAKVKEASEILHVSKDEIRHVERQRGLIREWVKVLHELIAKVKL
jgi:hypothetical protein